MAELKYALIGCGKVAKKHVQAALFHHRELRLTALVDTRPNAPADLCQACGLSKEQIRSLTFYQDFATMLAEESPDIVAITTPSGSHYAVASASIAAGAHVILEKPLTLSLEEADRLLVAAEARGVRIAVGHIYRFFPLVQMLQEDLQQGRLGRILYGDVKVRWGHGQDYYDQAAWRGTWAQDGGALMNQSIHALDLMTWLLGSPVSEVSGWISRLNHQMEAEDFGLAMLRLENGSYCHLEGTTCTDPQRQEAAFTIICTAGEIRCGLLAGKPFVNIRDREGHELTFRYLRRFAWQLWRAGGLRVLLQLKNPHSGLYGDMIRAIHEGRPPLADGQSGRRAVELVLAIYQSARTNQPVALPLKGFSIDAMAGYLPTAQDQA